MRALQIDRVEIQKHDTISQNYSDEQLEKIKLISMKRYSKPLDQ